MSSNMNGQSMSLHVDPDYLTNQSISPMKQSVKTNPLNFSSVNVNGNTGNSSKFNLINRNPLNSG